MNAHVLKHSLVVTLTGLVIQLFIAQVSFAAIPVEVPGAPVEAGPSSGTMVAAALETAGYKSQADVLEQLRPMLIGLAALLYVGSVISALLTIAQGGKYEAAAWYFVGPSLFLFVCGSTTMSAGAEWQFGVYRGKNADVQKALDNIDHGQAKVAWLFDQYNRLISDTIQQLIGLITNRDEVSYLTAMARQQMMDHLFTTEINDPSLFAFAKFNLQHCSSELDAARRVALGNRDPNYRLQPEYTAAEALYRGTFNKKQISIPGGIEREYLIETLGASWTPRANQSSSFPQMDVYSGCLADTANELGGGTFDRGAIEQMLDKGVSCQQMWCWMGLGAQQLAVQAAREAQDQALPADIDPAVSERVWQDIVVKMTTPDPYVDLEAREYPGAPPDLSVIPVIISGYMVRKMMTQDLRSEFLSQFAEHADVSLQPFQFNLKLNPEQSRQVVERQRQQTLAEAKRYEIFHWAMSIPYFQGAILYILATTFPFFALMIIIPGQAGAFFQWMALWAWVKSWDLGFAIVMVIDQFLWTMMPHNAYYHQVTDPIDSPITLFQAAFQGDPAYSLANYYVIVGTLLTAVPLITGQMILGSKKAIAGTLVGGLKNFSSEVGGWIGDYTALGQLAVGESLRLTDANKYGLSLAAQNAKPITEEMGRVAKQMEDAGQFRKSFGTALNVIGAGLGLAAVGVAYVGSALVSVPATLLAGGVLAGTWGNTERTAGFGMTREASRLDLERSTVNSRFHWFNHMGTQEARAVNAIRGGESNRGQYWDHPDNPAIASQTADEVLKDAISTWNTLDGYGHGGVIAGGAKGVQMYQRFRGQR